MEEPNAGKAGIPIVVGILVGLLASFVQSLGELVRSAVSFLSELNNLSTYRIDYSEEESHSK